MTKRVQYVQTLATSFSLLASLPPRPSPFLSPITEFCSQPIPGKVPSDPTAPPAPLPTAFQPFVCFLERHLLVRRSRPLSKTGLTTEPDLARPPQAVCLLAACLVSVGPVKGPGPGLTKLQMTIQQNVHSSLQFSQPYADCVNMH